MTDNFSPQTHGPFSRCNLVWGVSETGRAVREQMGTSRVPGVWPGEPPGVGECAPC